MKKLIRTLNHRRECLGLSHERLADMAGVSLPTVQRLFSEEGGNTSFGTLYKIAKILGIALAANQVVDEQTILEERAHKKARRLAGVVQGTSALEAQGMDKDSFNKLERQFFHKLMAGSKRKLWSA